MDQLQQFHKIFQGLPVVSFSIVLGLIVLILGRRFFWLFIGAVGFIAGLYIAKHSLFVEPGWPMLLIGLIVGIAGAILTVYLQRITIIISGFFAGGYLMLSFVYSMEWHMRLVPWLFFVLGGILGAAASVVFFDWALIVLSSLTGATMIVNALPLKPYASILALAVLIFVGFSAQAVLLLKNSSQS
ncbi:MAG: hypothetical protein AB1427_19665 [Thermodesulfobacteriota bacterium]